ncbi:MAG: hypothetical protein AB8G05_12850 [Oligoflexales bacterium]
MPESHSMLEELSREYQKQHKKNKVILTFNQFISLVQEQPRKYIRNSWKYILDTMDYFGTREASSYGIDIPQRFKLFDIGTEEKIPIISGEQAQSEVHSILKSFNKSAHGLKLILLHGPNGSAKTSTIETIANGMQIYSQQSEGAIYRFNWIFPADREALPQGHGDSGTIGFGSDKNNPEPHKESYALLEDNKIASKLISEYKENPLFLVPMPYREEMLRSWLSAKEGVKPEDIDLPSHILESGLSKKNHQIFENLLNVYGGNLAKVFRHIQVERVFFSKQYRVGLSTVEPQMSIDAHEKQLTLDKNYSSLPTVLHTISFYQSEGELVEANRGMLEFSDLLKRPIESFKYLLNTIEKSSINLSSGTANLDITFFGTTNEKHLDSFKTIPDFSSFKGRMELVTVPYLLLPNLEAKIYSPDIKAITKVKKIAPHSIETLCNWAVMTRLKQPDPEQYPQEMRPLVAKLDPYSKVLLYEGKNLQPVFTIEEQNSIFEVREKVWKESQGMVVYEGRFGASPREIRSLLHRAANNKNHETLTPIAIFEELEKLTKDRTIYEFLQFEPRAQYHDAALFIDILKEQFVMEFETEIIGSMSMANEEEYDNLLKRYIDNVVAEIKKEKIFDSITSAYINPSQAIMEQVEDILKIDKQKDIHRNSLLSRIAAFKLENPDSKIIVADVFYDYLAKIKKHYYLEKQSIIEHIYQVMLALAQDDTKSFDEEDVKTAKQTFDEMQKKYQYDFSSTVSCLKFLVQHKKISKAQERKDTTKK